MTEPLLDVAFGAASHQGLVRAANEDSYLTVPPVFLVADGMGGHADGELASQAVVEVFSELSSQPWLTQDLLADAVERATAKVSALQGDGRAPGSTLTGVGVTQQSGMPCWLVFNVGDSRTHLLRDGEFTQISIDHSAAVRRGEAGRERNVITRALGAGLRRPVTDQWLIPAVPGDRILLCSDGLTNEVTPELITAILLTTPDAQEAARALVQAALQAGGRDNITVVVVDCIGVVSTATDVLAMDDSTFVTPADDTIPDEEAV
ncbi:MAG TPA: protein phosphatase 2C domain-containing protein [Arachnia sp.]|nr:protein phosphatase 2C domain-containing protein [Arachnia sp.]HMT85909.1 protein phosphatase 2C domain-containing protein [Arachnia sp.]